MLTDYRVSENQSLYDVALQHYGSIEAVYKLIKDNLEKVVSLDSDLVGGMILKINTDHVIEQYLVDYFKLNNIIIATGN